MDGWMEKRRGSFEAGGAAASYGKREKCVDAAGHALVRAADEHRLLPSARGLARFGKIVYTAVPQLSSE